MNKYKWLMTYVDMLRKYFFILLVSNPIKQRHM